MGDLALASYASAAVESVVNEVISYTPCAEVLCGCEQKELTLENVSQSLENVSTDTLINGTMYLATGKIADAIAPSTASPYNRRTKIKNIFKKEKWATEMISSTKIQGILNSTSTFMKDMLPVKID